MRLTKKKENGFYELKEGQEIYGEENGIRLVQIVGEYEDLEEELGIDLVTFFKIRKHCYDRKPIFIKDKGMIIKSDCRVELGYKSVAVYTGDYGADLYPLKGYGKTWALTEEELL